MRLRVRRFNDSYHHCKISGSIHSDTPKNHNAEEGTISTNASHVVGLRPLVDGCSTMGHRTQYWDLNGCV